MSVAVPGSLPAPRPATHPSPLQLQQTLEAVSDALANSTLAHGLLPASALDGCEKAYRPDCPLWTPFKAGRLPVGLSPPTSWKVTLSAPQLSDLERLTGNSIDAAAFDDLLVERRGHLWLRLHLRRRTS